MTKTDTEEILATCDVMFRSDGTNKTIQLEFKDPVAIQSNVLYTASLKITSRYFETFYGREGLAEVIHKVRVFLLLCVLNFVP